MARASTLKTGAGGANRTPKPDISLEAMAEEGESFGSQRTVKAGFVSTFTTKFFNTYKTLLMETIEEKMKSIKLVDNCSEESFGEFFSAFMCRTDQVLTNFEMNTAQSSLHIDDEMQALVLYVKGINLQLDYGFKIWSEPEWVSDEGTGSISVTDTSIKMTLKPLERDGVLQVAFSDVMIDIRDYKFEMDGESDLSSAIEILFKNFKQLIRQEISNMLAWRFSKSIEKTLNMLISSNGEYIDLSSEGSRGYLNATLLQNPIFNKGFVSFPIDGSFVIPQFAKNKRDPAEGGEAPDFPLMPVFVGD